MADLTELNLQVPKELSRYDGWRKALAVVGALIFSAAMIYVLSTSVLRVSDTLPRYGFNSVRELHTVNRDLDRLREAVRTARLAPFEDESRQFLAKATDIAYIRFVRVDRLDYLDRFPEYETIVDAVTREVNTLLSMIDSGSALDVETLLGAENRLVSLELQVSELYNAFGDVANTGISKAQGTLRQLLMQIAFALVLLSSLTIGTALLLVNRHRSLRLVRYMAMCDSLTGLRNRNWANSHGPRLLKRAKAYNFPFSFILIDLDGFKKVNDTFGHEAGDKLLCEVARILQEFEKRCNATPIRIGGDEFVVIMGGAIPELKPHVDELYDALSAQLDIDGYRVELGASVGVSSYPENSDTIDDLMKHADLAMYEAKSGDIDAPVYFTRAMAEKAEKRTYFESRLRAVIKAKSPELYLVWQPQIEIATGRVSGAEALLRWRDPATGLPISPAAFIPVAEESSLVLDLDEFVIEQACESAARWARYRNDLTFAVNLSAKSFQDISFPTKVRNILTKTGLPADRLELEITEHVFLHDQEQALLIINQLKALGIRIALDDFGTGYSSLSYIANLQIDRLKIDRMFIDQLATSDRQKSVVRTVMALSRALDMEVVAEGVESDDQMAVLIEQNCHHAQGYLLSRPLDGKAIGHFLKAGGSTWETSPVVQAKQA